MIASELIEDILPTIKLSDKCSLAISWMSEYKTSHLPIVNVNKLVGLLSEEDLLDSNFSKETIAESKIQLIPLFIYEYQHIFEAIKLMSDNQLTILPILDSEDNYIGSTTISRLMTFSAKTTSIEEPGSILVLSVNSQDYSLAQIAQIIESNNARILSSYITSSTETTKMEVTIKVNKKEIGAILQTFSRYNYTVLDTFQKKEDLDELQYRYNHLMNILDL